MSEESECFICYSFVENISLIGIAGCNHTFCQSCLFHWCLINQSCPLDRRNAEEIFYCNNETETFPVLDFLYNELLVEKDSIIDEHLGNILSIFENFQKTIHKFNNVFYEIGNFFQQNDRNTFQEIINSITLDNLNNVKLLDLTRAMFVNFMNLYSNEKDNFNFDLKSFQSIVKRVGNIKKQYSAPVHPSPNGSNPSTDQDKCLNAQGLFATFHILYSCYQVLMTIKYDMNSIETFIKETDLSNQNTPFLSNQNTPSLQKINLKYLFDSIQEYYMLFKSLNNKLCLIKSLILLITIKGNKVKFIDQLEKSSNKCIICSDSQTEQINKLADYDKSICDKCMKIIHFQTKTATNNQSLQRIQLIKNKDNYHLLIAETSAFIYQSVETTIKLFWNLFQTQPHFFNLSNPTFQSEYERNVNFYKNLSIQSRHLKIVRNYIYNCHCVPEPADPFGEILDICKPFLSDFIDYLNDMKVIERHKITTESYDKDQLSIFKAKMRLKVAEFKTIMEELLEDIDVLINMQEERKMDNSIFETFFELEELVTNTLYDENIFPKDINSFEF